MKISDNLFNFNVGKIYFDLLVFNDGIYTHESNPPNYRVIIVPVRTFLNLPRYQIWYGWIFWSQV